jgi:hypothetical protein
LLLGGTSALFLLLLLLPPESFGFQLVPLAADVLESAVLKSAHESESKMGDI